MITGVLPASGTDSIFINAEEFFNKVKQYSGAEICWPSQLKIGAKTKKDPFVKVIGSIEQIEGAKKFIIATLQVKVSKHYWLQMRMVTETSLLFEKIKHT
ncbi:unnamed protein product [Strongylus vulgaris]|uniref:BICC1 first type I KH domain-containing protein n=1 Tax=Strongylus vulgaris TaxID=40348 RepID=A0A3P7J940_STRVU|nr:unnamed protein product [Strongylus vulgaris]